MKSITNKKKENGQYFTITNPFKLKIFNKCNSLIKEYRNKTKDVFLTSFKGLRADNKYRRRLDFKTAKQIMNKSLEEM